MTATVLGAVPTGSPASAVRLGRHVRRRRELRVTAVVVLLLVAAAVVALALGDYVLTPGEVWSALAGHGTELDRTVVRDLRLPRVVLAVTAGAAFGLAGGVFQTLFANPLASPDILGVTGGATVAAVLALLALGWSGAAVGGAAFLGAAAVAGGLHLVSRGGARHGRDTGHRFVLTGVAVAFLCSAVVAYLLTRAQVRVAQTALVWTAGSLGAARWGEVAAVVGGLAVFGGLLVAFGARLRVLQLGAETAAGLGVPVDRSRVVLLLAAVGLVASATAVVGPVGFVALCAPPIARRAINTGSPALGTVAVVGGALVLLADLVAQHAVPGTSVPTGVVTGAVGAPYLLWLLGRGERS